MTDYVKVKFSLCTSQRHTGGVDTCIDAFLTSSLDGGQTD